MENNSLEKFSGLHTQVQNLRKRLKEMDTTKIDPKEIASLADALEKLETRLEKQNDKKKQRMLEKSKEKTPEVAKESTLSETDIKSLFESIDPEYAKLLSNTVKTKEEAIEKGKSVGLKIKEVPKEALPTKEFKDKGKFIGEDIIKSLENDPDVNLSDEEIKEWEKTLKEGDAKVEDPGQKEYKQLEKQLCTMCNVDVKESGSRWCKHCREEAEKEMKVKEAAAPFEVDSIVEPVKGSPGSEGRVMIYDPLHKLVYVKWDKGTLKEKHDFGGYSATDLRLKSTCIASKEDIRKQLDEHLKMYQAATTMKEKEEHMQHIRELRDELSKQAEGVEGPSGIGYGDRPGIAVAPKRDEDVSLEAAWIDVANKKWWVEPKFDESTKKYIYKVLDDQKKPLMELKFDQTPTKEVIEQAIWEQLDKHAMLESTLKEDLAVLKKGHKVKILEIDKEKKQVKFASLENESVMGWAPLEKFAFGNEQYKGFTIKTTEDKSFPIKVFLKSKEINAFEFIEDAKKFIDSAGWSYGAPELQTQAWDMGMPAAIRKAVRAVQPHNYEVEEYDMVNHTFKKLEIPRKETKMRMDDPIKSPFEIRDPYGNWALTTAEVFNKWKQQWDEEHAKKFKKPEEVVNVPVEAKTKSEETLDAEEMEKALQLFETGLDSGGVAEALGKSVETIRHFLFGKEASLGKKAYIEKTPGKEEWCVKSEKGKNMGCYPSHSKAEERLKTVEMFKHMESKKLSKRDTHLSNKFALVFDTKEQKWAKIVSQTDDEVTIEYLYE